MKKKLVGMMLTLALTAMSLSGCGSTDTATTAETTAQEAAVEEKTETMAESADSASAEGEAKTYAIITKSAVNPYNEREASGFEEVITAAGYECIVQHPEAATADAQIAVINSLISQGVDAICIAANDENALQAALTDAMSQGIAVSCLDSKVNPESRATFVNQAGTVEIGQALMDAVYDLSGGEGQWAILSATSQAANQNAWIDAMKEIMETDEKFANLELVEIAYGDDEPQKSTDQTQALLQNYPDLKVICSPTTVGIAAAAKVLQDQGSSVKLTGLGLPSEMAEYIGDDDAHSCPYMFLWNPIDLGRLAAYTSIALVNGDITGATGDTFTAGDLGDYEVVEIDGATQIILGAPFKFDASNIDEWKSVY